MGAKKVYNLLDGGPRKALEDHCINNGESSQADDNSNFRLVVCGGDGSIGWALSVMDTMNIPIGKILNNDFNNVLMKPNI